MSSDTSRNAQRAEHLFRQAQQRITHLVGDDRAPAVIEVLGTSIRAAYRIGQADERHRSDTGMTLLTLGDLPPCPCCCSPAPGRHCTGCHGTGHARPVDAAPTWHGSSDPADSRTQLLPRVAI